MTYWFIPNIERFDALSANQAYRGCNLYAFLIQTKGDIEMSRILLLFSGGRDSFLSACRLLEEKGNELVLVTYTNGCSMGMDNVSLEANRIITKYGENRVKYLGVLNVAGIWRELFIPIMNLKSSEIISTYGEVTYSQINCLSCRMSMYVYSIALCRKYGINKIADGARYSQKFVIEQREMLDKITELLKNYSIELETPVVNLDSDWARKNELLMHGFIPKTLESQCLLGVPLKDNVTEEVINGVIDFYEKEIVKKIPSLVKRMEAIIGGNMGRSPNIVELG